MRKRPAHPLRSAVVSERGKALSDCNRVPGLCPSLSRERSDQAETEEKPLHAGSVPQLKKVARRPLF